VKNLYHSSAKNCQGIAPAPRQAKFDENNTKPLLMSWQQQGWVYNYLTNTQIGL